MDHKLVTATIKDSTTTTKPGPISSGSASLTSAHVHFAGDEPPLIKEPNKDNYRRREEDQEVLKQSVADFSFDEYQFFAYDQSEYLKRFVKEQQVQEFEIRKQLTEMVYIQVINKLNGEYPSLPKAFFDNKVKWCNLLLKTKPLQTLFTDFTTAIGKCLEKEIRTNKELIDKYLRHPRPHTQVQDADLYIKLYQGEERFTTWEEQNKHRKIIPKMNDLRILMQERGKLPAKLAALHQNKRLQDKKLKGTSKNNTKEEKEKAEAEVNYQLKAIQDKLVGIHSLVKDFEGNTDEMAIDMRNFQDELDYLDTEKPVEVPGVKISRHLHQWEEECPKTTEDEI